MDQESKYLLVDQRVLPQTFGLVVKAKRLLTQGKARNLSEAAKMAGISRSALYKYKDSVFAYNESLKDNVVTFSVSLEDEPGALSAVIAHLYGCSANILTVNQNIPIEGAALVSFSVHLHSEQFDPGELMAGIGQLPMVLEARLLGTR